MAPKITLLKDIALNTKNYTIEVMVIEKNVPRMMSTKPSPFQKLQLQDTEGMKIQATIFGDNVHILGNTLKLHHIYWITNAGISKIPDQFRFLDHEYRLTISGGTLIEEANNADFSLAPVKHNFTPIQALPMITDADPTLDVIFAVLEVGPRKLAKASYVIDVRVIDQGFQQTLISLWDKFTEYEAQVMQTSPDQFPIVIGLRLKTSKYYGLSLATRPTSSFIFDPKTPEAIELQAWCITNADKFKELPNILAIKPARPTLLHQAEDHIMKLIDIPETIPKARFIQVQGIARVIDFNQKFYYRACSICKRSTNAYGDTNFWCKHCAKKVTTLPKLKFNIQITDLTATIQAIVFPEVATDFYGITATELIANMNEHQLSLPLLHKLAEPKSCNITLKGAMYQYNGKNVRRFIVQSMTIEDDAPESNQSDILLALHEQPPHKKFKKDNSIATSSSITPAFIEEGQSGTAINPHNAED